MTAKATKIPGPTDETVASNVKRLRADRKLTYAELAERLADGGHSIPVLGLRRIEHGERRVSAGELFALAVALQVSPLTLALPWPERADAVVEVSGIGATSAGTAWDWARGISPHTVSVHDPDGDSQRFRLDSLPPWQRQKQ